MRSPDNENNGCRYLFHSAKLALSHRPLEEFTSSSDVDTEAPPIG